MSGPQLPGYTVADPDIVVKPIRKVLVLDGNDMQRCPDCGASEKLRMCAIRPYAVVWCQCQRAWPYPTLTFRWLVDNVDHMSSDGPSINWNLGSPIPAEVMERGPGLDVLVDNIEAIVFAGYVNSHRRLTGAELDALFTTDGPSDLMPG